MKNILIAVLLAALAYQANCDNLCGMASCSGRQHIDCILGEEGSWGTKCTTNKTMLDLRTVQDLILARHNEYRNKIAGGQVAGFPKASRMGTFIWDIPMANLARKNVRQCELKPDGCRNTADFDFVGQNLAYYKYPKEQNVKNIDVLLNLIDLWYNEIEFATAENINPFNGSPPTGVMGHFAQMMKDLSSELGCAAAKVTDATDAVIFFACNYNLGNIKGYPTYTEGNPTSGCKTGKNTTYTNLCSTSEVYNVNTFWTEY